MIRVVLLQESRADAGIYWPLIRAMRRDTRCRLRVIHHPRQVAGDWLIVLGDRRAMLEATINAAYANIPIAHIQGGDRSGTIDEPCRHAITRFANLHFPCTQASADRLIRMGEQPGRIKVVGPLGIYAMRDAPLLSKEAICAQLGLDPAREIVLVIQHPVSTQVDQSGEQMERTLEACHGLQTVVIYPNSDPGSEAMIGLIETCVEYHKFRNLPYLDFISLLRATSVVVGNSSTGLYEAPLFGVPAVNIGTRQQDRESGSRVWDAPHDADTIRTLIAGAISKGREYKNDSPFNVPVDGVKIIMDTIAGTPVDQWLLQKRLTY